MSVFSTSHRHFSSSPHCAFSQPATLGFQLTNKSKHRLPSINHIKHTGRAREGERESESGSNFTAALFFLSSFSASSSSSSTFSSSFSSSSF